LNAQEQFYRIAEHLAQVFIPNLRNDLLTDQ